jgi:uncharacterized protein
VRLAFGRRALSVALRLLPLLLVLSASRPARALTLDVEDLVGDGSLTPATLRLISDAVRGAALRHPGNTRLEVLPRPATPALGPKTSCDFKRAAARSAQALFCGEYTRVEGSIFATFKLVDASGRLLGTQTLDGPPRVFVSKVNAAADSLFSLPAPASLAPRPAAAPAPQGGQVNFRDACQRGDAQACIEVARSYGVVRNPAQSTPWVRRACDLRNAQACGVLGENYERGRGVPVDYAMAGRLYDFSCSAGNGDSCCSFGRLIVDGKGAARDVGRAKIYFDRGCQAGSGIACSDAGYWASQPLLKTGFFPNFRSAFSYYEKACELSEANGCGSLGGFYEEGWGGVQADTFRAQHYYERACSLGRGESCADRDRMVKVNSEKDVHVYIHHRR